MLKRHLSLFFLLSEAVLRVLYWCGLYFALLGQSSAKQIRPTGRVGGKKSLIGNVSNIGLRGFSLDLKEIVILGKSTYAFRPERF